MYNYGQPAPAPQQEVRARPPGLPEIAPGAQPVGECANCGAYIFFGEPVVEMFMGVAHVSAQNGQMLAEAESEQTNKLYSMHRVCSLEFCATEVCPDEAEEQFHMMAEEMAEEMIEAMMQEGELEERYRQRLNDEHS